MSQRKSPHVQAGGFVLAGGASRRMGRNKALLEIGGEPLFLRAANLLKVHLSPVVLLGAPDQYMESGFPTLRDRWQGRGPLMALLTGIENAAHPWNVFLACDLPLIRSEFIELLLRRAGQDEFDAVVPRINGEWQPLCAAYRQTCLPTIREAVGKGKAGVIDVLADLRVDVVGSDQVAALGFGDEIFENVNTPEDWQKVLLRTQSRSSK